jgi:hypothetical protein
MRSFTRLPSLICASLATASLVTAALATAAAALALQSRPAQASGNLSAGTFAQVTDYLRTHPEVRSVDAFLEALSPYTRNQFVLMHQSGSLQRACATRDNPRIIFTGSQNPRLMIAAVNPTGDASCKTFETVEFIEHIEKEARFEMHAIEFGAGGPVISQANPPRCLTCHSQDPHPIWGSYHLWNGAYGSHDDTFLSRAMAGVPALAPWADEYEGFESFMADKRHVGIYRHLNWADGRDEINRGRPPHPVSGDRSMYNPNFRPNFAFHIGLKFKNQARISRIFRGQSGYESFKHAIYYAQACVPVDGVAEIVTALPESARAHFVGLEMPRAIPENIKQQYDQSGDVSLVRPYNAFVADQLRRYDLALAQEESAVPRQWWGFLKAGHPLNPTHTELPRLPDAMGLAPGELVAPVEYFLNAQGETTRGWFLPFEGYIGTDGEQLAARVSATDVGYLDCPQVKARAIDAITGWARDNELPKAD